MNKFETSEQKWFKQLLTFAPTYSLKYVEWGESFIRFRDEENDKLYELRIKEIKPKKNKT